MGVLEIYRARRAISKASRFQAESASAESLIFVRCTRRAYFAAVRSGTVEGDKFIAQVDGAWNEFYKGSEQVRFFELTGDKLSIRTPEQQSAILIGKRTVATLIWEREGPSLWNTPAGAENKELGS